MYLWGDSKSPRGLTFVGPDSIDLLIFTAIRLSLIGADLAKYLCTPGVIQPALWWNRYTR